MNRIEKGKAIRKGLQKGFQDGTSKMARRKCYGYDVTPDGLLVVNPAEAKIVRWIFERYHAGDSLGQIADALESKGVLSPSGKPRWSREAISKLLSNEKYTGRVLLQKTVRVGVTQIENDGFMNRYLYANNHEAIISDELFAAVQRQKQQRSKNQEIRFAEGVTFW